MLGINITKVNAFCGSVDVATDTHTHSDTKKPFHSSNRLYNFSMNLVIFQSQCGQIDQGDDIFLERVSYVFESPSSFFKALN